MFQEEETPWNKLTEKLIYLNRCLYLVTENPKQNAWHLGFAFLAMLALRSDDYIETCDIYRKKHSCRCYVLLEVISAPPRLFDARDATTQNRGLKPTKYTFNQEVGVDVFEIVGSVGMRFSILNAGCMGTTQDQAWIVRLSENLGSPSSHACSRAFVHGWTRWAGWPELVRCDRGLEAPEQIGRVER